MNLPAIVGVLYMHANYVALEAVDALADEEEYDEDDDDNSSLQLQRQVPRRMKLPLRQN